LKVVLTAQVGKTYNMTCEIITTSKICFKIDISYFRKEVIMEHWITKNIVVFIGKMKLIDFKVGITLGSSNCIYLGLVYFGLDFIEE
jgi:hypothetical protein